jgi:hypothetical protein
MKKFIVAMTIAMVVFNVLGQNVTASGSVEYSSKNVSLGTGLVFSEEPAVIFNGAVTVENNKFGVSASYSGYCGTQRIEGNQFHLVDLFVSYKVNKELTLLSGPEFTYSDNGTKDETGTGLILMATYNKSKLNSTGIFYSDPKFKSIYVISSVNYQVNNNISIDGLIGATNAEAHPLYGLAGVKFSKGHLFAGAHYIFRSDARGPVFNVGFSF